SFTAGALTVTYGFSTTLTAVFSDGTGAVSPGVGAVTSGVAAPVTPTTTTTYTLTVTNPAGNQINASVTVNVVQPPFFTSANSATMPVGASAVFTVTTGGQPPVSAITYTGALPTGVGFVDNADGTATLSGTPSQG